MKRFELWGGGEDFRGLNLNKVLFEFNELEVFLWCILGKFVMRGIYDGKFGYRWNLKFYCLVWKNYCVMLIWYLFWSM